MSEPIEWKTGDVITADRLNVSVPLVLHVVDSDPAAGPKGGLLRTQESGDEGSTEMWLDKTWQEINDAFQAFRRVYIPMTQTNDADGATATSTDFYEAAAVVAEAGYWVHFLNGESFGAGSPNEYPRDTYEPDASDDGQ